MVRTKQTAKKSTGGTAPRISLTATNLVTPSRSNGVPCTQSANNISASLTDNNNGSSAAVEGSKANVSCGLRPCLEALLSLQLVEGSHDENNNFCHLCADGGELWRCDLCVRSECKKCVAIPPECVPLVAHEEVKYLCLSCHLMDDMKTNVVQPYMAFYRDRSPVLPRPPQVRGRFELSPKSFVQTPITVVLNLRLKTLPADGAINMLFNFLRPYFIHSGGFLSKDMAFDLGTESKRKTFRRIALETVKKISALSPSVVIIAISTHTDEDRGDLFAGHDGEGEMAAEIQEFLDVLLDPFRGITDGAILYMLSCGRYIRHSDPRSTFSRAIAKLGFSVAVAFDARRFHPSVAWAFLVTLTDQVVIQGHSVQDALPVALGKSNDLNRHSGIYLITVSEDRKVIDTTRYLWSHRDYRPWGIDIPAQCPVCGVLVAGNWKRVTIQSGVYLLRCPNSRCAEDGKRKLPYTHEVKRPRGVVLLPHGKTDNSAWTKKNLRAIFTESRPSACQ